jgi:hypothetical protein
LVTEFSNKNVHLKNVKEVKKNQSYNKTCYERFWRRILDKIKKAPAFSGEQKCRSFTSN